MVLIKNMGETNYYTVLIVGDVDVKEYDKSLIVEPYVAYKFSDRSKIKSEALIMYKMCLENLKSDSLAAYFISHKRDMIQDMTDEEYFEEITKNMTYDELTGDAISTINPNGKYQFLGPMPSDAISPFGDNIFEGTVADLLKYEFGDVEKKIALENFDELQELSPFKSHEEYVEFQTSFFTNAFVSKETGWLQQIDEDQVQWGITFQKRFIEPLPLNTKIKIMQFF